MLIQHLTDEQLADWKRGQTIYDILVEAHKHISVNEDQDDFDSAVFGAHRYIGRGFGDNSPRILMVLVVLEKRCGALFFSYRIPNRLVVDPSASSSWRRGDPEPTSSW